MDPAYHFSLRLRLRLRLRLSLRLRLRVSLYVSCFYINKKNDDREDIVRPSYARFSSFYACSPLHLCNMRIPSVCVTNYRPMLKYHTVLYNFAFLFIFADRLYNKICSTPHLLFDLSHSTRLSISKYRIMYRTVIVSAFLVSFPLTG